MSAASVAELHRAGNELQMRTQNKSTVRENGVSFDYYVKMAQNINPQFNL